MGLYEFKQQQNIPEILVVSALRAATKMCILVWGGGQKYGYPD